MIHFKCKINKKFFCVFIATVAFFLFAIFSIAKADSGSSKYLNITFIGSDYTLADMNLFHQNANDAKNYLLTFEPFKSRASQILFHYVDNTSDLGCSHGSPTTERFIGCNDSLVTQAVNNSGTPYDRIVVLVNDSGYGGSAEKDGAHLAIASNGPDSSKVVVHELGHSFGDLDDEYNYNETTDGLISDSVESNCYSGIPPASDWSSLVGSGDYTLGCKYRNWYRSFPESIMINIDATYFNAVSQDLLNKQMDNYAGPFTDSGIPTATLTNLQNGKNVSGTFTVSGDYSDNQGIARVELWKDGELFKTSYSSPYDFSWVTNLETLGVHTIQVKAYDVVNNVGSSSLVNVNVISNTLDHINISPNATQHIIVGQKIQFTAQGKDSINSDVNGLTYAWTGTDSGGLFTASMPGVYYVSVSSGGISSQTIEVDVDCLGLDHINISPVTDQNPVPGQMIQFTAQAQDSNGNNISGLPSFTWTDATPNSSTSARFWKTSFGVYHVSASLCGIFSPSITETIDKTYFLDHIDISPNTTQNITAGQTIQFINQGKDDWGNAITGWNQYFANPWTGTNSNGLFNNTTAGTYSVLAYNGINSPIVSVNVVPASLDHINISPNISQTITKGQNLQFSAQGQDQYNNNISGLNYNWTGTDSAGLFHATSAGIFAVKVSSGGKESALISVTVVDYPPAAPSGLSVK